MNSQKKIAAAGYLAIDLSSGAVLLQKNAAQLYPVASITKLMNAVVASENIDPEKSITITNAMLKPEGSSPCLFAGLNIKAKNLLQASLIRSSNDAAESLTAFLGKKNFLSLMNKRAKELKMANTVFYDAHGLDPRNRSTANDIAKLLTYIQKNHPEILDITKNDNFWLPDSKGNLAKFSNLNSFYYFSGFIGGKAGYLVEARQTFAGIFDINKKPVAIVILRSTNYQADIFRLLELVRNKK